MNTIFPSEFLTPPFGSYKQHVKYVSGWLGQETDLHVLQLPAVGNGLHVCYFKKKHTHKHTPTQPAKRKQRLNVRFASKALHLLCCCCLPMAVVALWQKARPKARASRARVGVGVCRHFSIFLACRALPVLLLKLISRFGLFLRHFRYSGVAATWHVAVNRKRAPGKRADQKSVAGGKEKSTCEV